MTDNEKLYRYAFLIAVNRLRKLERKVFSELEKELLKEAKRKI